MPPLLLGLGPALRSSVFGLGLVLTLLDGSDNVLTLLDVLDDVCLLLCILHTVAHCVRHSLLYTLGTPLLRTDRSVHGGPRVPPGLRAFYQTYTRQLTQSFPCTEHPYSTHHFSRAFDGSGCRFGPTRIIGYSPHLLALLNVELVAQMLP